jgi:hypothetical protein
MSEQTYTPENDPNVNLRSDLWPKMTISQLNRQHEIAIDKVSKLHMMMGANASPAIINIYGALQQALRDLTALIDVRAQQTGNRGL